MQRRHSAVRAALPLAIALVITFGLGALVGFTYAHEPGADQVVVRIDREQAADGPSEAVVGGEVVRVDGSRLVIETDRGPFEVDVSGLAVEELTRVDGLAVGATVNVGGEQTPFGLVLSGIVAIDGAATP